MTDWSSLFAALRDHAQTSPHPTEKIAAQLILWPGRVQPPMTNARPDDVNARDIPLTVKIANRSLYAHAETCAILSAKGPVRGATLLVTDPFCPNCAKQIALSGVTRVIVDGEGFSKPYFCKNSEAFQTLSLAILAWFGVSVFTFEKGALIRLGPPPHVVSGIELMDERAILPVRGAVFTKKIHSRGLHFAGPVFTDKYGACIEPLTVTLMLMAKRGWKPDHVRGIRLSGWPDNPRPFIDALVCGYRQYSVAGARPDWAGALASIGIEITSF